MNYDLLIESRLSFRKSKGGVCGVGHYDVDFPSNVVIDGKRHQHRAYSVWHGMLRRCYCYPSAKHERSYGECSVSEEWQSFSHFLSFWRKRYPEVILRGKRF